MTYNVGHIIIYIMQIMSLKSKNKNKKLTIRLSSQDYKRLRELVSDESMSAFVRRILQAEISYQAVQRRRDEMMRIAQIYEEK